jgi:uncharacterized phage protein gp47/JayE
MQITDLAYIDETGYHFADYPSFLAWRQEQYRAIYGADVYLEADSQDGQLLAIQAKADYDTAARGAAIYNSFSPATAQGTGLSRNVKINGLNRRVPSHSTVELTVVGQSGTVITNGIATDELQQKWLLPPTTIPGGGSVVCTAVAEKEGAVAAVANTVNSIFTPTRGWQTVNNAADATPGAPVETDAQLRIRQSVSTANPSLTVLDGTIGSVENLPGVTKVRGYENDTGSTDANGIPAHKISIVVTGGDDVAIAQDIALHKTPGTGTYGDTSELVYDAKGMPLTIAFNRAVPATIAAVVTISTGVGWSNDFIALIQAAVAAVINAGRIGDTILITKLYAPAYLVGTAPGNTFDVATLTISKNGGMQGSTNIDLNYNEDPVCDPATDVTVTIT